MLSTRGFLLPVSTLALQTRADVENRERLAKRTSKRHTSSPLYYNYKVRHCHHLRQSGTDFAPGVLSTRGVLLPVSTVAIHTRADVENRERLAMRTSKGHTWSLSSSSPVYALPGCTTKWYRFRVRGAFHTRCFAPRRHPSYTNTCRCRKPGAASNAH